MNPSSETIFSAWINRGDIQPEFVVVVARTCRSEVLISGHGFSVLKHFDFFDYQCVAALVVKMYPPVSRHDLPVTGSRQRTGGYPTGNRPNDSRSTRLEICWTPTEGKTSRRPTIVFQVHCIQTLEVVAETSFEIPEIASVLGSPTDLRNGTSAG